MFYDIMEGRTAYEKKRLSKLKTIYALYLTVPARVP